MKTILSQLKGILVVFLLVLPYFVMAEDKASALSDQDKVEIYNQILFNAVDEGSLEHARYAVENGADVNATDGPGHQTPLMLVAYGGLFQQAHEGHLAIVKYLVEETEADVNATDVEGDTPLAFAVYGTNENIFKYLVENGADTNVVNVYGRTLWDLAIDSTNENIRAYLFEISGENSAFDTSQLENMDLPVVLEEGSKVIEYSSSFGITKIVIEDADGGIWKICNGIFCHFD